MSHLPDTATFAVADMKALSGLITKLQKPLTNGNWNQEAKLLVRQVSRTITSLQALKKGLADGQSSP